MLRRVVSKVIFFDQGEADFAALSRLLSAKPQASLKISRATLFMYSAIFGSHLSVISGTVTSTVNTTFPFLSLNSFECVLSSTTGGGTVSLSLLPLQEARVKIRVNIIKTHNIRFIKTFLSKVFYQLFIHHSRA